MSSTTHYMRANHVQPEETSHKASNF